MTWQAGKSGNPKGRHPGYVTLGMAVRQNVDPEEIVQFLMSVMRGEDPSLVGIKTRDRVKAAEILANRGWGLPAQHVVVDGQLRDEMTRAIELGDERMAELTQVQLEALAILDGPKDANVLPESTDSSDDDE